MLFGWIVHKYFALSSKRNCEKYHSYVNERSESFYGSIGNRRHDTILQLPPYLTNITEIWKHCLAS